MQYLLEDKTKKRKWTLERPGCSTRHFVYKYEKRTKGKNKRSLHMDEHLKMSDIGVWMCVSLRSVFKSLYCVDLFCSKVNTSYVALKHIFLTRTNHFQQSLTQFLSNNFYSCERQYKYKLYLAELYRQRLSSFKF